MEIKKYLFSYLLQRNKMLWLLLFCAILIIFYWRKRKYSKLAKQIQSTMRNLPILGHSYLFLPFLYDDEARMTLIKKIGQETVERDGKLGLWIADRFFVVLADPVYVEAVLKHNFEKHSIMTFTHFLIGNGSIFAPVKIWRPRRKIIAPIFQLKHLAPLVEILSRRSNILVEKLREEAGKGPFTLWKYLIGYTMDSVCESTIGVQLNGQLDPEQPFRKAFEYFCNKTSFLIIQSWLNVNDIFRFIPQYKKLYEVRDLMCSFVEQVIKKKKESMKELNTDDIKQESFKTFLELLIENNQGLSDQELLEEALVLILTGTNTTAVGASFVTIMMARHPDVYRKLQKELEDVFGDSLRPVESTDLPKLKYLDAVIRETLRLYPPGPVTIREITTDVTLPSGETLVKGTGVVFHNWAIHRNPRYWEDAEVFRPERFINPQFKHPAQFMAFSYGNRSCMGYNYSLMSMKTVLATLLRRYNVLPTQEKQKHAPIRVNLNFNIKDVEDFVVELEPR